MEIYVPTYRPIRVEAIWTIKERQVTPISHREVWVPVYQDHNLFTNDGLTQLAANFSGAPNPPQYLVIDNWAAQVQNVGGITSASTSVSLDKIIDKPGDTQIVLSPNTGNEETRTFSARSGTGPYTYTIAAGTKSHAQNDYAIRAAKITDVIATIQAEVQYSPVAFPGKRSKQMGFFSSGNGNGTMQFYLTGSQANVRFQSLGLSESDTVGAGLLHSHLTSGYDHTATGTDVEVDVSITITN